MQAVKSSVALCQVIGENEQLLQVLLLPNQEIFLDAVETVYGSETLFLKASDMRMARLLVWPRVNQLRKLQNHTTLPEYLAVRKGTGKILCLELAHYEHMVVNKGRIVCTNY